MTGDELDVVAAVRAVLRHPLVRQLLRQISAEISAEVQPTSPAAESYIGTTEAARLVGVKPDTVTAWIGRGVLPAVRLPGSREWRLRLSDLEAALRRAGHADQGSVLPGAPPTLPAPTEAPPAPPVDLRRARCVRELSLAIESKTRGRK